MAHTKELIDFVLKEVKQKAYVLEHNHILFDIYEGDLLTYITADLKKQFSEESFETVVHRIAPINVLRRIVDKLSTIYAKPPKRKIIGGNQADEELLVWYEEHMSLNATMNIANELFNLHKTVTLEPYVDEMMPKLRAVPSDRSLMISTNQVDPTRPTIWVKIMGEMNQNGEKVFIYYVYTDDLFLPITSKGEILTNVLLEQENPDGLNPFNKIPSIYVNRSFHQITPQIDTDMLKLTKLIPILLTDLNYAVQFQAFSILYSIDLDTQNLRMSPNAFWALKSDPSSDKSPSVGSVKPTVDIQQVVQFIQAQLTFWLNTKNIRPGTVGGLSTESFASGISKIIDEMDTAEDRQKQVHYFKKAETQLWDFIINHFHPYMMSQKQLDTNLNFSPGVKVEVEFQEQLPMMRRSEILTDVIRELDKGLTTKENAIKRLNPEMSEEEIKKLLLEIDAQRQSVVEIEPEEEEEEEVEDDGETAALPIPN